MKYLYTAPDCPRCETRKKELNDAQIVFEIRSADRLKTPANDRDEIDVDAFVKLSQQNMLLPVEIDG